MEGAPQLLLAALPSSEIGVLRLWNTRNPAFRRELDYLSGLTTKRET
jgi:hypothetical protein